MVVFFDIDGTIVDDATQIIPDSCVRAVEQLRDNGHIPVINSGRPFTHIDPRIRKLAFAGWVCGCGMEVRLGDQWLMRTQPTPEMCALARRAVRECGLQVLYETADGGILLDGEFSADPQGLEEVERLRKKGVFVAQIEDHPQFLKFVTFDDTGDRQAFLEKITPWFTAIDRGGGMLEIMNKGCSKAAGMELLLSRLGIPGEETLAIGDSTNDLTMFRMAAHTACMGNGMEELKRESEFITDTVLHDGIEKALRHFGLI